jgi:hypothetical protein
MVWINIGATRFCDVPTLAELKAGNQVKKKGSFAKSMERALSKHPVENGDHEVAPTEVSTAENISAKVIGDANKRSSLPLGSSHKIAETMYRESHPQQPRYRCADF